MVQDSEINSNETIKSSKPHHRVNTVVAGITMVIASFAYLSTNVILLHSWGNNSCQGVAKVMVRISSNNAHMSSSPYVSSCAIDCTFGERVVKRRYHCSTDNRVVVVPTAFEPPLFLTLIVRQSLAAFRSYSSSHCFVHYTLATCGLCLN